MKFAVIVTNVAVALLAVIVVMSSNKSQEQVSRYIMDVIHNGHGYFH